MFRFVIGLVSGIAIGVAAAGASQSKGGQDLRSELERIGADLQQGNFDAVGAHLEERFKELQTSLEERFAEVEEAAAEAADETVEADEVADAADEVVEEVEEAVEEAKEA